MKKHQHVITTTDGKTWFGEPQEGHYETHSGIVAELLSYSKTTETITFALTGGELLTLPVTSILHVRTRDAAVSR